MWCGECIGFLGVCLARHVYSSWPVGPASAQLSPARDDVMALSSSKL